MNGGIQPANAASSCRIFRRSLLAAAGLALGLAGSARAASFSVNPTQVRLSAATRSALVSLRNESDEPLRLQLSVVEWKMDAAGQMQLGPTEDVVFFPALLTLRGREERNVRVGITVPPAEKERTYRLFIEELPNDREVVNGVRMLTKMGIPVFMQPTRVAARADLVNLAVKSGRLSFELQNAGTVHFVPQSVTVRGVDAAGAIVIDQKVSAWYVLAGGVREFQLRLPTTSCAGVRSISVQVELTGSTLRETLQTPGGVCGG